MGILNPLALAYLPLLGLLVLIYFFRKKHQTIPVPSFIPWRTLRQDTIRTRLFLADVLFFLQLIALMLLIFFLTQPYLPFITRGVIGKDIIVLIDTSASMQTLEGSSTRFQLAQREALRLVEEMGISDRMQIITAHKRPHIVSEFSSNKAELRRLIKELRPTDTGSNMEEGLTLAISLLRNTSNGELHVLTDVDPPEQIDSNVRFVNLARSPVNNVAIVGLDVYQDMFKEYREREAYVTLRNFSDVPKTVLLKAYLNHKPLTEETVEIFPGEDNTIRIKEIKGPGLLKVELKPDDALAVDNSAYAFITHKRTLRAMVVTEEQLLIDELRKIENATEQLQLFILPPRDYSPLKVKSYDMAVFHQYVPSSLPDVNTLFIFPPRDNKLFHVSGWSRGANFIDWDDAHPVMRHLGYMEELWIYKALHLEPVENLKPFIMAAGVNEDFPIALAGTIGSNKVVVLGFDIADFNLSKAKNMPILIMLLNIIQWLNPDSAESNQIITGEPFVVNLGDDLQGITDATLLTPDGKTATIGITGSTVTITDTDLSGEYVLSLGNTEKRFVANLFDAKESNVRPISQRKKPLEFREAEVTTYVKEEKTYLGKYILALAALLLLAEWILHGVRARTTVA